MVIFGNKKRTAYNPETIYQSLLIVGTEYNYMIFKKKKHERRTFEKQFHFLKKEIKDGQMYGIPLGYEGPTKAHPKPEWVVLNLSLANSSLVQGKVRPYGSWWSTGSQAQ